MDEALRQQIAAREQALARVRQLLVDNLHIPREPDEIDADAPLFGTGLGLDSVDAVEVLVSLESELGVKVPEGQASRRALRTVNGLVELALAAKRGARGP